jgi:hypothetical protein
MIVAAENHGIPHAAEAKLDVEHPAIQRRRATKGEIKERIALAIDLIVQGFHTGQIKKIFRDRFGVGHVQVLRYWGFRLLGGWNYGFNWGSAPAPGIL